METPDFFKKLGAEYTANQLAPWAVVDKLWRLVMRPLALGLESVAVWLETTAQRGTIDPQELRDKASGIRAFLRFHNVLERPRDLSALPFGDAHDDGDPKGAA
jgi:hypothetical protein